MGNVPSRYHRTRDSSEHNQRPINNDTPSQNNEDSVRFRDMLSNLMTQLLSTRPIRSVERNRSEPDVTVDRPSSTSSSGRYNLRRTVTRIRREQGQRPARSSTPRENSRIFLPSEGINRSEATSSTSSIELQNSNTMAPPVDMLGQERVEPELRRRRVDDDASPRTDSPRMDGPRLADNRTFPTLDLDDDQGRSLFFTFPWRNNRSNLNHIVLVRVRHLGSRPVGGEAADMVEGALQWTLFFLMPQGTPVNLTPSEIAIDPATVLAEAFSAFASLVTEMPMGYEELTRLQEMMGFVSRGVTTEMIDSQLKPFKYKKAEPTNTTSCSICLTEYQQEDSLRKLPCNHAFHSECIDKWLNRVNHCPLCRQEAVMRQEPSSSSSTTTTTPPN